MMGPWRLCLTIKRCAGLFLISITSSRTKNAAMPSGVRYWPGLAGSSSSMKRSWTSGPVLVKLQAILSVLPSTTAGIPGRVAPMTLIPGASMRAKYHSAGADKPKCGSLARSGLPLVVRLPLRAQLFEPIPSIPPGNKARKISSCLVLGSRTS